MPDILEERFASVFGGFTVRWTLDRPEAMNAFTRAMLTELDERVAGLESGASSARALVITGSGRAFSAGADLKERATMQSEEVRAFLAKIGAVFRRLERLPLPTIAALNGFAFGGGLELALCCDLRVASADALLGLTETSLGIIPGAGGTQRLTRTIGMARAKELIFSARRIDAATAAALGLVNRVLPANELWSGTLALAEEMNRNAPLAIAAAKAAIQEGQSQDLDAALFTERKHYEKTIPTADRVEALTAFREKRDPVFQGR